MLRLFFKLTPMADCSSLCWAPSYLYDMNNQYRFTSFQIHKLQMDHKPAQCSSRRSPSALHQLCSTLHWIRHIKHLRQPVWVKSHWCQPATNCCLIKMTPLVQHSSTNYNLITSSINSWTSHIPASEHQQDDCQTFLYLSLKMKITGTKL